MRDLEEIVVNGVKIAYTVHGAPDAPPMVLLHGGGQYGESWDPVLPALAADHRVYTLDLRGHGASDWPGEYSFELMRDDVVAFLRALELRQIVLIGHSMGGTVAWLVAEDHSDLLTRLVVEDTPLPRPPGFPAQKRVRPDRPLPFDWAALQAVRAQLSAPDPAWWDRVSDITVPVLIIGGGSPSHVDQAELAELARKHGNWRLVTIPVGHDVHQNRPGEFLDAVGAFLNS